MKMMLYESVSDHTVRAGENVAILKQALAIFQYVIRHGSDESVLFSVDNGN